MAQRVRSGFVALLAAAAMLAGCATLAPRPLAPRVDVLGVRGASLAGSALSLRVLLNVTNPNPFPVALDVLEADIEIESTRAARGRMPAPVTLAASADTKVEIDAQTDVAVLGSLFERALAKGRLDYAISGFVVLADGRRFDYRRRGDIAPADLLGRLAR